jgi:WD40 repeat protein
MSARPVSLLLAACLAPAPAAAADDPPDRPPPERHGDALRALTSHDTPVTFLSFSPDGKSLTTVGKGRSCLFVWDVATGKPRCRRLDHDGPVCAVAWSRDGKTLAIGAGDFPAEHHE